MENNQRQEQSLPFQQDHGAHEVDDESQFVICDYCDAELELSDEELDQGWYVCPECNELSHLVGSEADAVDVSEEVDWAEGEGHDLRQRPGIEVECGHCGAIVNLSVWENKQGWFFCPVCHGQGQLGDYVTCLFCGSELELTKADWDQEWYRCPECNQVTQLVDSTEEEAQAPAADSIDQAADADWVQLKTAVGPEEAALEVAFLRANGIEAFTWQEGAGHAYGLTIGMLGASHVMVREDQVQMARLLFEDEEKETLVECTQCGTSLELSEQEVAQGHFICPECRQLIQLPDYVICPICQSELALDAVERKQGWYRCPECDQVTHL